MRRKNLMRLTAAMGMMMACSQVMQAAAPVWGNETVEETTAGSHDDLIEIPTLEDEEYPVDQGKQNYVDTIVQADNRIGSMLMEKLTAENKNVFISSYSIATALTLLSHCSESGGQIEQLKEFLDLNNMSESEILAAQEELAAILGTNKENQEDEEDENALWDDEEDTNDEADPNESPRKKRRDQVTFSSIEDEEAEEQEQAQRRLAKEQRLIDELEADAEEHPIEDDGDDTGDEQPERKLLKRELRAQALKRLEDSARTLKDYENLVAWYDRLDANRQRKERYHELYRSGDDVPLDYGAAEGGLYFPDTLNDVLSKLERKGDFVDSIFYCPYDIHELVTDGDISNILRELSEDSKFLMFLWALRQYSSVRIAAIRGQSDRNIRKVRNTMLKKIRKKLLAALTEKVQIQQPLTLLDKDFLRENGVDIENNSDA